jgi:hypothetical protein
MPALTDATHALTIEPHAPGTVDIAAHALSNECAFTLKVSGRVVTMRDVIDARGRKHGEINSYRMSAFEGIVRDLAENGTTFLFTCCSVAPRTARKYLQLVLAAGFEPAGVVWNYDSPLGDKVERISRVVFRPRATGEVAA